MDVGATTALVARITLAAAFGWSAMTKLAAPAALTRALASFGIPGAAVVARSLPPVEAGLAVVLVAVRTSPWPAYVAIAVLVAFTAAVAANLARGEPAPCPCFGLPAVDARPVSAATVARNGGLIALAVLGTGSTEGASATLALATSVLTGAATVLTLRRVG